MSSLPVSGERPPSGEEIEALTARILASPHFVRSPKLQEFLRFVVTAELEGRGAELSEKLIGQAVFHKGEHYDPAHDNVVRANARLLRKKLEQYFSESGKAEPWIMEIPVGGYRPSFRRRISGDAALAPPRPLPWKSLSLALAALCCAMAAAWLWQSRRAREPETLLSLLALRGDGRLVVVVADTALVLYQAMGHHLPALSEYVERQFVPPAWLPQSDDARRFWEILTHRLNTDLTAVQTAALLWQRHPSAAARVQWRHPLQFRLRDLDGENLLFAGGVHSIPWAAPFEKGLNFERQGFEFVNRKPRQGEQPRYTATDRFGLRGKGYVRVSVQPLDLGRKSRVLHVEGSSWVSSEAGIRFLLDPSAIRKLEALLPGGWREPSRRIELLLETEARETAPSEPSLVAWRLHD